MGSPQAKRQRKRRGWEDPEDPISSESQQASASLEMNEQTRAKCSSDDPLGALELTGFADGACRGNPGRASWGAVLWVRNQRASANPLWEGNGVLEGLRRTNNEVKRRRVSLSSAAPSCLHWPLLTVMRCCDGQPCRQSTLVPSCA